MKKISLYIYILLISLLTSCMVTKNGNTKSVKLTNSVSNHYSLARHNSSGKTTGETFSMFFDNSEDVVVKRLWVRGINLDFEQVKTSPASFRLRGTFYKGTKSNIHDDIKEPMEHSGKALVEYQEGGETKYYVVKEFKVYDKTGKPLPR